MYVHAVQALVYNVVDTYWWHKKANGEKKYINISTQILKWIQNKTDKVQLIWMDWGARQNDGQKQNNGHEKEKKMTD